MKSILIPLLFIFASCGKPDAGSIENDRFEDLLEIPPTEQRAQAPAAFAAQKLSIQRPSQIEKKVIKTGNLTYKVDSKQEEYLHITGLLKKYEAYVSSENEYKGGDRINVSLQVKVPHQHFDALISEIAEGRQIENRSVNATDVTDRYYDLDSRIKNKKKLEERYLQILKEANSVSELLEVERSLNQVRSEIESLEGQFKLMNHQITFSRLDLSFYEVLPYQLEDEQRPGFGKRLLNALAGGWGILLSVVVGLVQLWPFGLLAILIVWGIRKFRQRKKK